MSCSNNNSELLKNLSTAVNENNFEKLKLLLSTKDFDCAAKDLPNNSIILACKQIKIRFIEASGSTGPEFDGGSFLHLASSSGDLEMVKALVNFDNKLCFVKNKSSMIPLHTAIVNSQSTVISSLVLPCTSSLEELTSSNETVFHLAVKSANSEAFQILLEIATEKSQQHLLAKEDHEGNTVFHIAVSQKLIEIMSLMSSCTDFYTLVSTAKNKEGRTAMDLYCDKLPDPDLETLNMWKWNILAQAGCTLFPNQIRNSTTNPLKQTQNVLLVVLTIFVGLGFTVICGLPTFFPRNNNYNLVETEELFQFLDVISGKLPQIFYIIEFITVLLTISTTILTVLLYWLPWGSLMILGGIATFLLYALLAKSITPKFNVKVNSYKFSSYKVMWIGALGFIFSGWLVISLGKRLLLDVYNIAEWLKKQLVSILRLLRRRNGMLPR